VWKDMNGNGIWDTNEQAISSIVLNLNNSARTTTTTGSNGCYVFPNQTPGPHQVQLSWPNNNYISTYKLSPPDVGSNQSIYSSGIAVTPELAVANAPIVSASVPYVNFGLVPVTCPLTGEMSAPCGNGLPFTVSMSPGGTNEFCVSIKPANGVTISQIDYLSFQGMPRGTTLSAGAVTGSYGEYSSNSCWVENSYSSGNVCRKQGACTGFSSSCGSGDINYCMACGSNSYVAAPMQACFTVNSNKACSLEDFVGKTVLVGARGINGYCANKVEVSAQLCTQQC